MKRSVCLMSVAVALVSGMVIVAVSEMIDGGGKMAEECRDAYNSITGEDWINSTEAAKWAADPDNYEVPEAP